MSTSVVNKITARLWAQKVSPDKYAPDAITLGQLRELVNSELGHLGDDTALMSLTVPVHIVYSGPNRPARIDFVLGEI